jgi:hypothetical protein
VYLTAYLVGGESSKGVFKCSMSVSGGFSCYTKNKTGSTIQNQGFHDEYSLIEGKTVVSKEIG